MTQEFPNQTSSPLWTSESVRLEKLAWRQELGRRAIARSRMYKKEEQQSMEHGAHACNLKNIELQKQRGGAD